MAVVELSRLFQVSQDQKHKQNFVSSWIGGWFGGGETQELPGTGRFPLTRDIFTVILMTCGVVICQICLGWEMKVIRDSGALNVVDASLHC